MNNEKIYINETTGNNPCNILDENSSISDLKWIGALLVQLVHMAVVAHHSHLWIGCLGHYIVQ